MGAFSSSSCSGPVALPRTESSPPRAESAEDSGAGLGGQQALQMRFLRRRSPSRLREAGAEGEPPPVPGHPRTGGRETQRLLSLQVSLSPGTSPPKCLREEGLMAKPRCEELG